MWTNSGRNKFRNRTQLRSKYEVGSTWVPYFNSIDCRLTLPESTQSQCALCMCVFVCVPWDVSWNCTAFICKDLNAKVNWLNKLFLKQSKQLLATKSNRKTFHSTLFLNCMEKIIRKFCQILICFSQTNPNITLVSCCLGICWIFILKAIKLISIEDLRTGVKSSKSSLN